MQASVKLPRGVHVIRKASKDFYYYQAHRGTPLAGPRIRLPDDPAGPEFWGALRAAQGRRTARGGFTLMVEAYEGSPAFLALRDSTRREYTRYLREWQRAFGQFDPAAILPRHVATWRDKRAAVSASAADAAVAALRAIYTFGVERGFSTANPATGIRRVAKAKPYEPWPAWAIDLIPVMRESIASACRLGVGTGQRLGDVLRMRLTDIVDGKVVVRQQKTGTLLEIRLGTDVQEVVKAARARGHIYLVSKPDGAPYTVDQFHAMWGREVLREEIAPIRRAGLTFHGLRKTATVRLIEAGCTPAEAMAVTGHRSTALLDHYSRAANQPKLADSALAKLEGKERE
jgi:integrase